VIIAIFEDENVEDNQAIAKKLCPLKFSTHMLFAFFKFSFFSNALIAVSC